MTRIKFTILLLFSSFCLNLAAQEHSQRHPKINEIFFKYISENLRLNPEEAVQMRPLVTKYLEDRKKKIINSRDPLEREQQILSLKIIYRKQMAEVIGLQRANAFFTHEQAFRRKVREELKQRRMGSKNN